MLLRDIALVGVTGINPDFLALARACHCHAVRADSEAALRAAIDAAFNTDRPTLIEVKEKDAWLD